MVELKDYIQIFKRRGALLLGVFLLTTGALHFFSAYGYPTYKAQTRLIMEGASAQQIIADRIVGHPEAQYIDFGTRRSLVRTEKVLQDTHKMLLTGFEYKDKDRVIQISSHPNLGIERVIGAISCTDETGTTFAFINAQAQDPVLAADMANAATVALLMRMRDLVRGKLNTICEAQGALLEKNTAALNAARDAFTATQKALGLLAGVTNLDDEVRLLTSSRIALEEKAAAIEMEVVGLREAKEALEKRGIPPEGAPKLRELDSVCDRIDKLEYEMADMLVKYTADYAPLQTVMAQLALLNEERIILRLAEAKLQIQAKEREISLKEKEAAGLRKQAEERHLRIESLTGKKDPFVTAKTAVEALEQEHDALEKALREFQLRKDTASDFITIDAWAADAQDMQPFSSQKLLFECLVGLVVAITASFLREHLDNKIHTQFDVKRYLNLPVISVLPNIKEPEKLLVKIALRSALWEIFNRLAAFLNLLVEKQNCRVFMVTSSAEKEGKSTILANIGTSLGKMGKRTILVDCDLHKPVLHKFFGIGAERGLSTYLSDRLDAPPRPEVNGLPRQESPQPGEAAARPSVPASHIVVPTEVENLFVMPGGPVPENSVALLESAGMKSLLAVLKARFDVVLLDTPPLESTADPLILADKVDATILVVGCGATQRHQITWAKRMLQDVEAKMLGVVLNRSAVETREYYYYHYGGKKYHREGA
ncbi:MAG: P-loop NTPase [Planctomycetota bacterium]|nr:P-loop NTPase [Planctomycetota bacterium]